MNTVKTLRFFGPDTLAAECENGDFVPFSELCSAEPDERRLALEIVKRYDLFKRLVDTLDDCRSKLEGFMGDACYKPSASDAVQEAKQLVYECRKQP